MEHVMEYVNSSQKLYLSKTVFDSKFHTELVNSIGFLAPCTKSNSWYICSNFRIKYVEIFFMECYCVTICMSITYVYKGNYTAHKSKAFLRKSYFILIADKEHYWRVSTYLTTRPLTFISLFFSTMEPRERCTKETWLFPLELMTLIIHRRF